MINKQCEQSSIAMLRTADGTLGLHWAGDFHSPTEVQPTQWNVKHSEDKS